MTVSRRILARVALSAALLCASIAGAGASTASAATAKLTITPTGYANQCYVTVGGNVSGSYPRGFTSVVRIWGDDPVWNDLLIGPLSNSWPSYHNGFGRELTVPCSTFNEDWEGRDEIFASVQIYDATGRQTESASSANLYGYY